jgi:hypothetical protein
LGVPLIPKSAPLPVKLNEAVAGALEVRITEPTCAPAALGANVTLKLQEDEGVIEPEHVLLPTEKSPFTIIPLTFRTPAPVLVRVTV